MIKIECKIEYIEYDYPEKMSWYDIDATVYKTKYHKKSAGVAVSHVKNVTYRNTDFWTKRVYSKRRISLDEWQTFTNETLNFYFNILKWEYENDKD